MSEIKIEKFKPTENDISKIGAELLQLMNQRFVMANIAITFLVSFMAWTMSRKVTEVNDIITNSIAAIVLSCVIFVIYIISRNIHKSIRIFSTYLVVSESSNWEIHFKKYREKFGKNGGLPNAFVYIFPCLIFLPGTIPIVCVLINTKYISFNIPYEFLVVSFVVGSILTITCYYMEKWMKEVDEKKMLENWEQVLKEKVSK